jgi:hypothetical protein
MVIRWLIVVLTLIGAIPMRICTCGAAHHHPSNFQAQAVNTPNHASVKFAIDADPEQDEHHDHDCHVLKPRPIMSVGVQLHFTDVPSDDLMGIAFYSPIASSISTIQSAIRISHPPPNRPLYITLRVIRN